LFYQHSCEAIGKEIRRTYPKAAAIRYDGKIIRAQLPDHLLWMITEIGEWDCTSAKCASKAGRWIGWMYRAMEELNLWTNLLSRARAKEDVEAGYHLPHSHND